MSDDDDIQESGVLNVDAPASNTAPMPVSAEENPPPKPPRPLSPMQQAENTLKEAFPSIDAAVVKAVLVASGGNVEPAFNALLGTDYHSPMCETLLTFNRHVRPRRSERASSTTSTSPTKGNQPSRLYSYVTARSR